MADLGGIEAVVSAMAVFPDSIAIQVVGCAALRNIAQLPRNEIEVAAAGGVEVILDALRLHGANAAVQEARAAPLFCFSRNAR